jgi:hypothetical protein
MQSAIVWSVAVAGMAISPQPVRRSFHNGSMAMKAVNEYEQIKP